MALNVGDGGIAGLCAGDVKIKKAYLGDVLVYSIGNTVTYYVDSGITYQEDVEEGQSCLHPKTFSPYKRGWDFLGWRENSVASGSVLSNLLMGDSPVSLYAVFAQDVDLDYDGNGNTGGNTWGQSKTRYYNNGSYNNPSFTLANNGFTKSGYDFLAWASGGPGGTQYPAGRTIELSSSTTMYAVWEKQEERNPATDAPPFLGAGWSTLFTESWSMSGQIGGAYIVHASFEDLGTRFIYGSEISTGRQWVDEHGTTQAYLFHSTGKIDTDSYSRFDVSDNVEWDDDTSEGRIVVSSFPMSRFSDDGTNWTEWLWTDTSNRSYKYAQVGMIYSAESDSAVAMWFSLQVSSVTFS